MSVEPENGQGRAEFELPPWDEYNRALVANVHPPDWINPEPAERYNIVVIGAGTAGLVTAAVAAGLGAKVALIERQLMGGDCLNSGCVPSKALLRSAHAIGEIRAAADVGVHVPESAIEIDFPKIMERMRSVRSRISALDSARRFRDELGVDVFFGDGRFEGRDSIEVEGAHQHFKKAVIATGARPFVPPIPGLAEAGYYTNDSIFSLTTLPAQLLIIGGGPIGCELAQCFARFGSRVTLVEAGSQFLAREDPDAAALLRTALEQDGVDVRLATTVSNVSSTGKAKTVTLESGDVHETLDVAAILVGAGRRPNTENIGLEAAGVEADARGIVIDEYLRTKNKNVFAAGDVCMATKFTHAADFAARAVAQNALFLATKKLSTLTIPWCTYTQPEIAHVGLYEHEARDRGIEVVTHIRNFSDVDRSIAEGDERGFVKIHVEKGRDKIIGATIVAKHAGDLISEISVAMAGDVGLSRLSSVIHPYPTQADAIRQIGDAHNRTKLTPFAARALRTFFSFSR
jgi:pyruvate/2-oxoglutarate dehydrogenase complex dihydrolipoamide dehydrogenase (E3) component